MKKLHPDFVLHRKQFYAAVIMQICPINFHTSDAEIAVEFQLIFFVFQNKLLNVLLKMRK